MEETHLISSGATLAVFIIGYFIRSLINDLKDMEVKVNSNSTKIEVLSSNHANLDKKIDSIFEAIKGLSQDIKDINNKRHE